MNLTVYVRQLKNLSKKSIEELFELTLGGSNSVMKGRLNKHCYSNYQGNDLAVIAKLNGQIVGWSLSYYEDTIKRSYFGFNLKRRESARVHSMFFVNPLFRGKGVGKFVFDKTKRAFKKRGYKSIYTAPWDETSDAFFKAMNCKEEVSPDGDYLFTHKINL